MTAERGRPPEREPESYWQEDVGIGEIEFQGDHYPLWMRLHRSREAFREHRELTPLEHTTGERLYLHAKPYILVPDFRLTVALNEPMMPPNGNGRRRPGAGQIGQVLSSERVGWRSRDLGNAQGWCYPADRIIMLWECFLEDWCRRPDPVEDPLLERSWVSFEYALIGMLPQAERIATPSWEDLYPRDVWRTFLVQQGYEPESPAVFGKALPTTETVDKS